MRKLLKTTVTTLMVFALIGCGTKISENTTTVAEQPEITHEIDYLTSKEVTTDVVQGGWRINYDEKSDLSQEDIKRFETGTKYVGIEGTPIDIIATQVVSGVNYQYLCYAINHETGEKTWSIVTVYENLDGDTEATNRKDINLADYVYFNAEPSQEQISDENAIGKTENSTIPLGGWKLHDAERKNVFADNAEADALMAVFGAKQKPVALFGKYENDDTYLVLVREYDAKNAFSGYKAVQVHIDSETGTAKIVKTNGFDIALRETHVESKNLDVNDNFGGESEIVFGDSGTE